MGTFTNWSNGHTLVSATCQAKPSSPVPLQCHLLLPPLNISQAKAMLGYQAISLAGNKSPPSLSTKGLSCKEASGPLCVTAHSLANLSEPCFYQVQSRVADELRKDCETGGWKARVAMTCPEGQEPAVADNAACSSSQLTLVAEPCQTLRQTHWGWGSCTCAIYVRSYRFLRGPHWRQGPLGLCHLNFARSLAQLLEHRHPLSLV